MFTVVNQSADPLNPITTLGITRTLLVSLESAKATAPKAISPEPGKDTLSWICALWTSFCHWEFNSSRRFGPDASILVASPKPINPCAWLIKTELEELIRLMKSETPSSAREQVRVMTLTAGVSEEFKAICFG